MRIAIYSRKSVDTKRGESIENQVEMCRHYILQQMKGGETAEISVYEDEGFSGKSLDRPRFQCMLSDARRGKLDCIVCYRLDRISRSVGDFAPLAEELIARGIGFVCIKEQFDTTTPMGKAMMYIASVFAQLERETIAERVRDNMLMLARTGRWLGGTPPTGFEREEVEEISADGKRKNFCRLCWNDQEREVAKAIYQTFLTCRSVSGTAKRLEELGMRSRTGKAFSLPGIREILSNPVYCTADRISHDYFVSLGADVCFSAEDCTDGYGLVAYHKRSYSSKGNRRLKPSDWIIALGRHKGLVCGQDWTAAQHLLRPSRGPRREPSATNGYAMLSGLITCAHCHSPLIAKARSGNRKGFDYICGTKLHKGADACCCQNLGGQQADQLVWASAVRRLSDLSDSALLQKSKKGLPNVWEPLQPTESPSPTCLEHGVILDSLSLAEKRELLRCVLQKIQWDGESLSLFFYSF